MATKANTTVGISLSGADKISATMNNYVNNLKKSQIAIAASVANIRKAVKGTTSEKQIIDMDNLINANMKAMLSNLDQYRNVLSKMKTNYKANDSKNSTFVSSYKNFVK